MADTPIPAADLASVTPGTLDSVVGVDESTKEPRRFPISSLPMPASVTSRLTALEVGQTAGMLGYATKALMTDDLAHAEGTLALVTNDATAANNGTYRKTGASGAGSWVLSADRVTGLEADIGFVSENFNAKTSANVANPNVADANIAGPANQLHRVYSTSDGSLGAQLPASLGAFAVARKYDVTAGVGYVASVEAADSPCFIYLTGIPRLVFFNSDGTFHSVVSSGFTVNGGVTPSAATSSVRSVEFTAPVGAEKIGFTLNRTDYSNSVPMTTAAVEHINGLFMLNTGATAAEFEPYVVPGTVEPDPDAFDMPGTGPIKVTVQGRFAYVRTAAQQSADKDLVWKLLIGEVPDYALQLSGVFDLQGARLIARTTKESSTVAAFNKSTEIITSVGDERTPVHINGMYLGAGHGIVGYKVTMAAHGKTDADVGSIWNDGTRDWVLTKIVSTSVLFFLQTPGGTAEKWTMPTFVVPVGSTFTHVSGATNTGTITFSAPTISQLYPILQNRELTLYLDGEAISADGTYDGSDFRVEDNWDIPNAASLVNYLKANIGSTDYTNSAIDIQVSVSNTFTWNRWGAMTLYRTEHCKQAFDRVAGSPGDYSGGIQMNRLSRTVDAPAGMASTVHLYVPDIATVGGFDLQGVANITANASFVLLPKASCTSPTDPASHFAMLGKDGSGVVKAGMLWGYSRKAGLGVPAVRAASVTYVGQFSSAEKQYPIAIDIGAGDAVAGDVLSINAYRAYFLPTDAALTIPAVIYSEGGKEYAVITSHTTQAARWVALPPELIGKQVSVLKADANVILHSPTVQSRGVMMTFATSYGDVILEIG